MVVTALLKIVLGIIKETPLYVWAIFGYILHIGIKATKTRTVWIPQLFITPLVLIGLKLNNFLNIDLITGINYLLCLITGCILGHFFISKKIIEINKKDTYIKLAGSYQTLVLLILFFCVKYFFGFLKNTKPDIIQNYLVLEHLIGLLVSGYFLGIALRCFKKVFEKPL